MEQRTVRLNFDLSFVYGPRTWRVPIMAVMLLAAVGELNSESVTLSTYYPAPSGVYTNMITTGNTFLARDGGAGTMVGIGTIAPNQKLTVAGNANVTGFFGARQIAPTQAVDVIGNIKVAAAGACSAAATNGGGCAATEYITWAPGVYVNGFWSTGPGVVVMPAPPGESNGIVLKTPTYYCCPR